MSEEDIEMVQQLLPDDLKTTLGPNIYLAIVVIRSSRYDSRNMRYDLSPKSCMDFFLMAIDAKWRKQCIEEVTPSELKDIIRFHREIVQPWVSHFADRFMGGPDAWGSKSVNISTARSKIPEAEKGPLYRDLYGFQLFCNFYRVISLSFRNNASQAELYFRLLSGALEDQELERVFSIANFAMYQFAELLYSKDVAAPRNRTFLTAAVFGSGIEVIKEQTGECKEEVEKKHDSKCYMMGGLALPKHDLSEEAEAKAIAMRIVLEVRDRGKSDRAVLKLFQELVINEFWIKHLGIARY
ncbi:hypothetical protein V8C35DRAFT_281335 [Trichoderma chlorosporum]